MTEPKFECVLEEEQYAIRSFRRTCSDLAEDHRWHFHPEFEITWMIRGRGTRLVGDHIGPYGPGDLVLSGPNLPHCWRNEGEVEAEWIVIQFDPVRMVLDIRQSPEAHAIAQMLERCRVGLAFGAEAGGIVGEMLCEVVEASGMRRIIRLLEILDRLGGLPSMELASVRYHRRNSVDRKLVRRLDLVQRYIAERFRGEPCQAEIAAQLGMAPSAFSRFYRSATGSTFMGMVKLMRINEACRLLIGTDEPITEIALQCGYQHTSHFDRHFRQVKQLSPTGYRQQTKLLHLAA